jgi:hypothetical protein
MKILVKLYPDYVDVSFINPVNNTTIEFDKFYGKGMQATIRGTLTILTNTEDEVIAFWPLEDVWLVDYRVKTSFQ